MEPKVNMFHFAVQSFLITRSQQQSLHQIVSHQAILYILQCNFGASLGVAN